MQGAVRNGGWDRVEQAVEEEESNRHAQCVL